MTASVPRERLRQVKALAWRACFMPAVAYATGETRVCCSSMEVGCGPATRPSLYTLPEYREKGEGGDSLAAGDAIVITRAPAHRAGRRSQARPPGGPARGTR